MSAITQFRNPEYSNSASWICGGRLVEISNGGRVIALLKKDGRVLVVHVDKNFGKNNAFIYSANGDVERQIMIPESVENAMCFDDAYYDGPDITLIAASKDRRMACIFNEDGELIRIHESR
jgi:hypothetical protein